uniref:Tail spike protein n=1 Tax=Klebsiella phage vB_Kpn16-P2 TaxID=3230846 RepID=A0AAU8EFF1_9VIRU
MNKMFTQPTGPVAKQTNKQAIARVLGIKQNQVVYLSSGQDLTSFLVAYDKATESVYRIPSTVSGKVISYAINNYVCTVTTDSGQYTLLPVLGKDIAYLTFDMFGVPNDGLTDATAGIKTVAALAKLMKLPVKQNTGVYLISGSDAIEFTNDTDLSGITLLPTASYTGYLLFTQPDSVTVYDSASSVVAAVNSQPLLANSSRLGGLVNNTVLNGKSLFMYGSDPLYVSRGTTKYWWSASRLSSKGRLDTPLKYSVASVTQITTLTIAKKETVVKLPNWDFGNGPANLGVMRFTNITRYKVYGGSVFNRPLSDVNKQPVIISINYAYGCKFEGFYDAYPSFPSVNGSIAYAYTLNHNYTDCCTFKNFNSQGDGWGVVGGQLANNITYINCNLNRVDMHDPFMGYMKLIDCDLGYWGICASGMGDLYLERCTVNLEDFIMNGYREHDGIISTRGDFGGFFDGNVYIRDLKIIGDATAFRTKNNRGVSLFSSYSFNATTGYIPAGSPIEPWGFKEIYIDGLHCDTPIVGKRFSSIVYAASVQYTTYFPRVIQIKNADFNSSEPECFDMHGFLVSPDNAAKTGIAHTLNFKPTNFIQMDDCSLGGIEIQRPYSTYDYNNVSFRGSNLKQANSRNSPIEFYTDQIGRYEFVNCDLKKISDSTKSTGSTSSRQSVFSVNGGVYNSLTDSPFDIKYQTGLRTVILCSNVNFVGPYSQTTVVDANLNVAEFATLDNCKFYSNITLAYVAPALWLGSTSNSATAFNVARGNTLNTVISNSNTNAGGGVITGITTKVDKVPNGVSNGHIGGVYYVDAIGQNGSYQLYLNARDTKAQVGKIVSNGTISGIFLQ